MYVMEKKKSHLRGAANLIKNCRMSHTFGIRKVPKFLSGATVERATLPLNLLNLSQAEMARGRSPFTSPDRLPRRKPASRVGSQDSAASESLSVASLASNWSELISGLSSCE